MVRSALAASSVLAAVVFFEIAAFFFATLVSFSAVFTACLSTAFSGAALPAVYAR